MINSKQLTTKYSNFAKKWAINVEDTNRKCNLIMEAVISESLFGKQKSSFDMLNRNWVFILLFNDIILSLLINNNNNNDNNNNDNNKEVIID